MRSLMNRSLFLALTGALVAMPLTGCATTTGSRRM